MNLGLIKKKGDMGVEDEMLEIDNFHKRSIVPCLCSNKKFKG